MIRLAGSASVFETFGLFMVKTRLFTHPRLAHYKKKCNIELTVAEKYDRLMLGQKIGK